MMEMVLDVDDIVSRDAGDQRPAVIRLQKRGVIHVYPTRGNALFLVKRGGDASPGLNELKKGG